MTKENRAIELSNMREEVYSSYRTLLRTGRQPGVNFPTGGFLRKGGFVYLSDEIEDDEFEGKTYLHGRILYQERIGKDLLGLVVATDRNGIELFEHYTNRSFRPMLILPNDQGVIADKTALEKNLNGLEGHSPEEIIGINFDLFPLLKCKHEQLSAKEYQKFYLDLYSKWPLFI